MNKISKITITFLIFLFVFFIPSFSFAQSGLIPCGTEKTPLENKIVNGKEVQTGGNIINSCKFEHIFELINDVVNFVFVNLALPISAIMFAYAGFLLIFSGGESGKRTEAKKIFWNVAIGLILAAASWLIVHTVLSILGYNTGGDFNWFGF